jgi:hypothetical protein
MLSELFNLKVYGETMKRAFEIHFFKINNGYELVETKFMPFSGIPIHCVRGKTAGAFKNAGTFQWTAAVRAISALFLRHAISQRVPTMESQISGHQSSLAASLDYALSKAPRWMGDMFGLYPNGQATARRLFLTTNPNQKRPGPVIVSINDATIAPGDVRILIDGHEVFEPEILMEILKDVEKRPEEPSRLSRLKLALQLA